MRRTSSFKYMILSGAVFLILTACAERPTPVVNVTESILPTVPVEQPAPVVTPQPEILTGLPCTLETQAPALIAKAAVIDQRWDAPQHITPEVLGNTTQGIAYPDKVFQDDMGDTFVTGQSYGKPISQAQASWFEFIVKYDPKGIQAWSQQISSHDFPGTSNRFTIGPATVDQIGNMYLTVSTAFVPVSDTWQPETLNKTWLIKLGSDGKPVWTRALDSDVVFHIKTDAAGHLWMVSGLLNKPWNPNPSNDLKLRRYDPDGQCRVEHEIRLAPYQGISAMASDDHGFIYLAGIANNSSPSTGPVPSDQNIGPFIMKLNWKGETKWLHHLSCDWVKNQQHWTGINLFRIVGENIYVSTTTLPRIGRPRGDYLTKYDFNAKPSWTRDIGSADTRLFDVEYNVLNFAVLPNGDQIFITKYDGYYPNCCASHPGWEFYVSHLDKNGKLLTERMLANRSEFGQWADRSSAFVMQIRGYSDNLIVEQYDPTLLIR
jgi:hypothetical protein